MTVTGQVHLATSVLALASGAAVLVLSPKGSRWHRRLGWTYAVSMLAVNVTALMIYKLFGGFGPFHAAAIVALVGLIFGVRAGRRARAARLEREVFERTMHVERHYMWMTWSYVGLLAAFASEIITRVPALRPVLGGGLTFGLAVGFATFVIVAIGSQWIKRAAATTLAPFRRAATEA